jgi:hypothetical protein
MNEEKDDRANQLATREFYHLFRVQIHRIAKSTGAAGA